MALLSIIIELFSAASRGWLRVCQTEPSPAMRFARIFNLTLFCATEGLKKLVYDKEKIGHVMQIIRGAKIYAITPL